MTPPDIGADWRTKGALRIRETAAVLSVSESTIRRGIKAGGIPTVSIVGQTRIPVRWVKTALGESEAVETKPSLRALEKMGRLVS